MLKQIENPNEQWTHINVTRELRSAVKRIAADQDTFVYNLTEKVFRQAYPDYFKNQEIKHWQLSERELIEPETAKKRAQNSNTASIINGFNRI